MKEELKIKDVMIGDWVDVRNDAAPNTPHLERIAPSHFLRDEHWYGVELVPEILEKNGFIKYDYKDDRLADVYRLLIPTSFEKSSFTIQVSLYREPMCGVSTLIKCWGWLPPYNGGLNDIHLCSANYVHQLQHALRLCGIEKEIIL